MKIKVIKVKAIKEKPKKVEIKKVQGFDYWAKRPLNDPEKDWDYGERDWLQGYVLSIEHPHRQLILKALDFEWAYLLEIGCNVGPNLALIRPQWENRALFGIDANPLAIGRAKGLLEANISVQTGDYNKLPYPDQYFDVVLADATLLYAGPKEIDQVLSEINRVVKKKVILVERYADSLKGEVVGHVWARDYTRLLENLGFTVHATKLTEEMWPTSKNWIKYGYVWVATR